MVTRPVLSAVTLSTVIAMPYVVICVKMGPYCMHSIEGESSPCTPESSKFTVLYYNARSLIPKMDELHTIVESQRPSVICVVETWLSEEVSDQEISLSEYQVNV